MLKYGFPLGVTGDVGSDVIPKNHKGARDFPDEMEKILHKEIMSGTAIGPFDTNPLRGAKFSPLNSVPKKEGKQRRLILDLSFPQGQSINDGIDKDLYLGEIDKLVLPSVDLLADQVMKLGKGCKLFKIDLVRGYRQINLDPGCIHWVGYVYKVLF